MKVGMAGVFAVVLAGGLCAAGQHGMENMAFAGTCGPES
jgi:hypothetical protein